MLLVNDPDAAEDLRLVCASFVQKGEIDRIVVQPGFEREPEDDPVIPPLHPLVEKIGPASALVAIMTTSPVELRVIVCVIVPVEALLVTVVAIPFVVGTAGASIPLTLNPLKYISCIPTATA